MTRKEAKAFVAAMTAMREKADDALASVAAAIYPTLKQDGSLVKAGTRINWNGVIKKAASDLWDTPENNPDNAPDLWADLAYIDGYRIIPEVLTVTTAFAENECGWWHGVLYRSRVNGNVYTPDQYPNNWENV